MADATSIYISSLGNVIYDPVTGNIIGCPTDGSSYASKCQNGLAYCSDCWPSDADKTAVFSGLTWQTACIFSNVSGTWWKVNSYTFPASVPLSRSYATGPAWKNDSFGALSMSEYANSGPCVYLNRTVTLTFYCTLDITSTGAKLNVTPVPGYTGLASPFVATWQNGSNWYPCNSMSFTNSRTTNPYSIGYIMPFYGGTATVS